VKTLKLLKKINLQEDPIDVKGKSSQILDKWSG